MTVHTSAKETNLIRSSADAQLSVSPANGIGNRQNEQGSWPLSFSQQSMWFWDQFYPNSALYNVPFAVRLFGSLDREALQASLNLILARHEILRTRFFLDHGAPVQVVTEGRTIHLPVIDISALPASERESKSCQLANQEAQLPFDFSHDLMLRARLIRLADEDHVFVVTMHHIASDGWSMGVFLREMSEAYAAQISRRAPVLPELPFQYPDFALRQRAAQGPDWSAEIAFWKEKLAGSREYRHLTPDHPRPVKQTFRGATEKVVLPNTMFARLTEVGQRRGASLFMTAMAALHTLLHRYSGHDDIFVAFPIANRNRPEVANLIGFFANTLVFAANVSGNPTFLEFLERIRDQALDTYANQELPFEKLVEELQPNRSLGHPPLYQVMLVFQDSGAAGLKLPGLTVERFDVTTATSKCDLSILIEKRNGFEITFEYNRDLFEAATVKRMAGHYVTLLEAVVSNPESHLGELAILTEPERQQLVSDNNQTQQPYPEACVHELFEAQVKRNPDAVALVFKNEVLTYRELDERANQLAARLRVNGVRSETLVGVLLERSPDLVTTFLAVLKAGGAYLPLDPEYPTKRLSFLMENAGVQVVLALERFRKLLPNEWSARVIALDQPDSQLNAPEDVQLTSATQQASENFSKPSPDGLAYVLYTSGSTGTPKGVEISHRGIVRLLLGQDYLRISQQDVLLQLAPLSFDTSVIELWGSLLHGAKLILFPGKVPTAREIAEVIRDQHVTTLGWLTTSLFNLIIDEKPDALAAVREVIIGGEALSVPHIRRALQLLPNVQLINGYGPTENSALSTTYRIPHDIEESAASIPIGKPIATAKAYVLDRYLQPLPVGVAGELYVGGDGISRGYRNQPALTAERFIANPFSSKPGERIYKTGDRARYLPDGNIEYLGRLDHQVKIRGFRIELGEVESNLLEHPRVRAAAATDLEDTSASKSLAAYIVAVPGESLSEGDLRSFLRLRLPDYMIPSRYGFLESMPLLSNGKVDRGALGAFKFGAPSETTSHIPARNSVETELVKLWENLLGKHPVGVTDNFYDLGGHSLLAVRLVAEIESAFGKKIDLSLLVSAPTVENLAEYLRNADRADCNSVVAMQPLGSKPPLYCVHGGGGHVLRFRDLAQSLGTDQPFFGLRAPLFNDYGSPVTVEFLATKYLADIRRVQAHGPYHLAGASFGGLVAYEMACQLVLQGEEVGLVALFDTGNPAFCHSLPRLKAMRFRTLHALEKFRYRVSKLTGITTGREVELAEKLIESVRVSIGDWLWKLGVTQKRWGRSSLPGALWDNLKLFMRAAEAYRPKTYPGRIILFKAVEQNALYGPDAKLGWGNTALGGVQIIDVPGDHMSLLEKPRVFQLANHLRACIEAAELEAAEKKSADLSNLESVPAVNTAGIENILPLGQES